MDKAHYLRNIGVVMDFAIYDVACFRRRLSTWIAQTVDYLVTGHLCYGRKDRSF